MAMLANSVPVLGIVPLLPCIVLLLYYYYIIIIVLYCSFSKKIKKTHGSSEAQDTCGTHSAQPA
jgi:hypothetical protein